MGCDRPSQGVVWDDRHGNIFYSCPMLWLKENEGVFDWYDEYSYQKEFGTAMPYHEQSPKFIECHMTYSRYFNLYQIDQMRSETGVRRSSDGLDQLAAGWVQQQRG